MKPVASASRNGSRDQAPAFLVFAAMGGPRLLRDARNGYVESTCEDRGSRQVSTRTDAAATECPAPIKGDKNLIVDAGFDAFADNHGDARTSSAETFRFGVPIRLEVMHLPVHHVGEEHVGARLAQQFRLPVASWHGGPLPQINTVHGAVSPRWLRDEGMSNVGDGNAHNVVAHIPISQHKCGMPATTANVATIASTPLTRACPWS